MKLNKNLKSGLAVVAFTAAMAAPSHAQEVKTISNPGGGEIVYGNIEGKGTGVDAMVKILRLVHGHFSAKPEVGKFFQDKSGTTIGVFFKLPKAAGHDDLMGLALVNVPSEEHRSGAIMYDSANHFPKSLRSLVSRLNEEWPPKSATSSGATSYSSKPLPLQTYRFPDNTGQVGLPEGWRPIAAAGGGIQAAGPNGEELYFNDTANNLDPSSQFGRQQIMMAQRTGRPLANHYFANSFRQSAPVSFVSMMRQRAGKQGKPMPSIEIYSQKVLEDNTIVLTGVWDAHDGRGPMALLAQVRVLAPMPNGSWTMFTYHMEIPLDHYGQYAATIPSIFHSFSTNDKLILAMNKQFVEDIHLKEAQDKYARDHQGHGGGGGGGGSEDSSDVSYRGTQAVFNYIRGNEVIGDTQTGGQATVGTDFGDELVRSNPNRLEVIPPSRFNHTQY